MYANTARNDGPFGLVLQFLLLLFSYQYLEARLRLEIFWVLEIFNYPTTSIFGKVVKFLHEHKFFAFGHIKIPGSTFIFVYFFKSEGGGGASYATLCIEPLTLEKYQKIFANYEDTCYLTRPDSLVGRKVYNVKFRLAHNIGRVNFLWLREPLII